MSRPRTWLIFTVSIGVVMVVFWSIGFLRSQTSFYAEDSVLDLVNNFIGAVNERDFSQIVNLTVYRFANESVCNEAYQKLSGGYLGPDLHVTLNAVGIRTEKSMSESEKEQSWHAIGAVEATMPVTVEDYCVVETQITSVSNGEIWDGTEIYGCFLINGGWYLVF